LKNPGFIRNNRLEIKPLVQVLDLMYLCLEHFPTTLATGAVESRRKHTGSGK
jgi:hypothetical protein